MKKIFLTTAWDKKTMNSIFYIIFGLLFALLVGCATVPKPLEISEVEELQATVVAVDADARTLVLRGPEGNEMGLKVGTNVRNLSQVRVGDILRVSYYTGFLFSIAEPGSAGTDAAVIAGREELGERPGAVVGTTIRETVEILSIASDGTSVSFRGSDGVIQSIDVPRKEGQAFARKLQQGDLVDIQYTEAVAINVQPADSNN